MYGAIEAGGTKFICAVGESPTAIQEKITFPTTEPIETLTAACDFFAKFETLSAIGVASFGPVGVVHGQSNYGVIENTPKPGWSGFNIVEFVANKTALPTSIDTDVNCALLAEARYGAGQGLEECVYITVGTGIGGGALVGNRLLKGFSHPELGHMLAPRHPKDDHFPGVCPFHGNTCFEGLASGPAMEKRWQCRAEDLPPEHEAWELEGYYLAALCANVLYTLMPKRIILGGGVMAQQHLFYHIRRFFEQMHADYIPLAKQGISPENFIVPVGLAGDAGVMGALLLAEQVLAKKVLAEQVLAKKY